MPSATSLDVTAIRKDFPILAQQVHDKPLIYLDNAATAARETPRGAHLQLGDAVQCGCFNELDHREWALSKRFWGWPLRGPQ